MPENADDLQVSETLAKVRCEVCPGESLIVVLPSGFVPITPGAFFGGGEAHKCTVVVTNQRLIFCDHDEKDTKFSFELSRADLERSSLGRSGNSVTIETEDGATHVINLYKGNVERLFAAIGRELPSNTELRDIGKLLLLVCIPVVWIAGAVLLSIAFPQYTMAIIAIAIGVPLLLCGFFLGRRGTVFVVVVAAFLAILNAIGGSNPFWVGAVVLLAMGGLSLLGEIIRAAGHGASDQYDGAEQ